MIQEFDAELMEQLEDAVSFAIHTAEDTKPVFIKQVVAKAALSVIAPYYEKQITELKVQMPQWNNDMNAAPKYDIPFLCRRKVNPCIVFEAMITQDQDGYENPVYDVLVNTTYEDDILDDSWDCYEWMPCFPKTAESESQNNA